MPRLPIRYRHLGQSYTFEVEGPYSPGHQLTLAEAQALNQLRSENIRENMRPEFARHAGSAPDNVLPDTALTIIQQAIDAYDCKFQFREQHEPRRPSSLQAEARRLAEARAPEGASEAEIELLAQSTDALTEARERLEVQARIAASALEDLL